ncbi:transcriptional repressor [Acetobacter fallax]|uniref:Transcriptional repressor n=1 Tax=Acetobacter fallax TaxID=1737473 RepID=A0ABX0KEB9_9PROT|nr:transcriptional repressor [Acetobacter fallax]NHO33453.1 transcriptional repressor [Acetobacter fallax]NHO37068.1 transcriptional repressor [Acetobacter fallax]
MTKTPIPALDRFSDRTERLLDRADRLCAAKNVKLTALRRQILGIMLTSDQPLGAYDLLDRLQTSHPGAAPPTVYRTLDFLLETGLIHKIERLSSFVPCTHTLDHDHSHDSNGIHATQFLICGLCSHVTELEEPTILSAILEASQNVGFRVRQSTIEIEGVCASCSATPPAAGPDQSKESRRTSR